jgi:non-reducing end alpha-L-arabinofuranosidase
VNRETSTAERLSILLLSAWLGLLQAACGDYPVASIRGNGGSGTSTAGTGNTGTGGMATGGMGAGGMGTGGTGAGGGGSLPPNTAPLPCDVLGKAGYKCVSAHSTVRLIAPEYAGALYQLKKGNATLDIVAVDGYADGAAHVAFCGEADCTFNIIFDQSGYGNHLTIAPPGSAKPTPANPAAASALPVTINGRSAFGIKFRPGQGYRAACNECPYPETFPSGVPVGDAPQTQYMISSQHDLINGCCFDYGNAEVTANNDGNGTMEAVYLGQGVIWGSGTGDGPWVMADMENGLFPGWENMSDRNISTNTPLQYDFVTAVVVGDTADKNDGKGRFALYGGDATVPTIKEMYDGIRPEKPGYVPMQKQGSVILAIGGDNSDADGGRFYEGVIALEAAPAEVINSLQAAIAEAGYGK